MKPTSWPDHLNSILAKSVDRGGETLAQHTWDVLEKLAALRELRPTLPELTQMPSLWHCLFWTCLLHDLGKSARGFQAMLKGSARWKQRHEVLSLVCLDWISDGLEHDELRGVVAAIVSHHRDASDIQRCYDDIEPDPLVPLLCELDPMVVSGLWRWIDTCAADWMRALGFPPSEVRMLPLMPHDEAVALVERQGARRMRHWLRRYEDWIEDLKDPLPAHQVVLPILLRGLTTTADHMASAHMGKLPDAVREPWQALAARVLKAGQEPYRHQEVSAARSGSSALLIAPTGSGKTEAALYWALGDGKAAVPRMFYALPYQASMNAMFDRLRNQKKGFGARAVGLQHGRALQALYARLMDQENRPATAATVAQWERNLNSLHARPIKVFSPYQMLKAAFQLRGFEAMLTDYAQAVFIFDEIHSYEPARLALILAMVRHLREHYGARFFVMSATFPQIIRDKLSDALTLGQDDVIQADDQVFEKFRRHQLHLLHGGLLEDGIDPIVRDVRAGRKVLVCANTVRRAQDVRAALLARGLARELVMLVHSRYIVKDRTEREQAIQKVCALGSQSQPFVLVATQVVEVSLNIDLDTIYTDPAPLEALLQRFGRVNRACAKGICPVHVFRQPDDGQYVYGRHKDPEKQGHIVRVTLAELARHDGEVVDEARINDWLDAIYADPQLKQDWEGKYQRMTTQAEWILRSLRPFNSDRQKEDDFERLFDNVDVLPTRFESEYLACLSRDEYVEASQYFVGIGTAKYKQLLRKGLILPIEDPDGRRHRWMVRLPYSKDSGLSFDPADDGPDWD